ncbi:subtilisin-like protein [Lactarius psammicola]|nr:subtilisin-like protein [Lactarius psammicola]
MHHRSSHTIPVLTLFLELSSQPHELILWEAPSHVGATCAPSTPEELGEPGPPPSGTTIDLYISLKPHHENALVDVNPGIQDTSTTTCLLTRGQVAELVAPYPETLEVVRSWFEYHGVPSSDLANAFLEASYQLYTHIERNETIVRTVRYALPVALHEHVTPRNHSGRAAAGLAKSTSGEPVTVLSSRDYGGVTPSFLRGLYGTSTYTPAATDRDVLGIAGFLWNYPSQADLTAFMSEYRSDAADTTFTVGGSTTGGTIRAPQMKSRTWACTPAEGGWARVTGTSHGSDTSSASQASLRRSASRTALMRLSARSVSVLFTSGNEGVGEGNCRTNDDSVRFILDFPATCPVVTVVGGTTRYDTGEAASFSGGGFSNYFLRPSYQQQAVFTYLQDLVTRPSGRGIPDIAAQAIGFWVLFNGNEQEESGTSIAVSVVASIISLLNDWPLSGGRPLLGFLNPWLYEAGFLALNDTTVGSNRGCNTGGFPATVGWGPVTGFGTPNFREMLEELLWFEFQNPTN